MGKLFQVEPPAGAPEASGTCFYSDSAGHIFELDARYVPDRIIGKGQNSLVCSALDTNNNERVAIKRISTVFEVGLASAYRTIRELRLLRLLNHPSIIDIRDVMLPSDRSNFTEVYIVFPLMVVSLQQKMNRGRIKSIEEIRSICVQALPSTPKKWREEEKQEQETEEKDPSGSPELPGESMELEPDGEPSTGALRRKRPRPSASESEPSRAAPCWESSETEATADPALKRKLLKMERTTACNEKPPTPEGRRALFEKRTEPATTAVQEEEASTPAARLSASTNSGGPQVKRRKVELTKSTLFQNEKPSTPPSCPFDSSVNRPTLSKSCTPPSKAGFFQEDPLIPTPSGVESAVNLRKRSRSLTPPSKLLRPSTSSAPLDEEKQPALTRQVWDTSSQRVESPLTSKTEGRSLTVTIPEPVLPDDQKPYYAYYTTEVDMWPFAATLGQLLTGRILFEPAMGFDPFSVMVEMINVTQGPDCPTRIENVDFIKNEKQRELFRAELEKGHRRWNTEIKTRIRELELERERMLNDRKAAELGTSLSEGASNQNMDPENSGSAADQSNESTARNQKSGEIAEDPGAETDPDSSYSRRLAYLKSMLRDYPDSEPPPDSRRLTSLMEMLENAPPDAKDLLVNLCHLDPNKRLDAVQALRHPFFSNKYGLVKLDPPKRPLDEGPMPFSKMEARIMIEDELIFYNRAPRQQSEWW